MNPSDEAGGVPAQQPPAGQPAPIQQPQSPQQPQPPAMTFPLPPTMPAMPKAPVVSGTSGPPAPQSSAPTPQNAVQPTTKLSNAPVIDDGDLIEKEWVSKAKQIVDKNRNDPHKQSQELTAFKADYMKQRYNKDIRLDE